jgi:hypothetical protein
MMTIVSLFWANNDDIVNINNIAILVVLLYLLFPGYRAHNLTRLYIYGSQFIIVNSFNI